MKRALAAIFLACGAPAPTTTPAVHAPPPPQPPKTDPCARVATSRGFVGTRKLW